MVYKDFDLSYKSALDDWKTGHYGEDAFTDTFECCNCGCVIPEGNEYFDVDGDIYCVECEDAADEAILDLVKNEYRYVL